MSQTARPGQTPSPGQDASSGQSSSVTGQNDPKPFSEHRKNIKRDVQHLGDDARDAASDAVSAGKELVHEGSEAVQRAAKSGTDQASEYHEKACEQIRKHPTASVAGAIAVGFVLGKLLGR